MGEEAELCIILGGNFELECMHSVLVELFALRRVSGRIPLQFGVPVVVGTLLSYVCFRETIGFACRRCWSLKGLPDVVHPDLHPCLDFWSQVRCVLWAKSGSPKSPVNC